MRRIVILAIGILAVAPLSAQEVAQPQRGALPAVLRDGRWLLDFTVQESSAGVGGWYLVSRKTALGVNVSADFEAQSSSYETPDTLVERDSERLTFTVEPAYRRYLRGSGHVASFVQLGAMVAGSGVSLNDGGDQANTAWRFAYGGNAGVGLQWFVTDALAISGQLMVRAYYSPFIREGDGIRQEESRFQLGLAQPRATFSLVF